MGRTTQTPLGVSFETYLRRCEDIPLRRLGDVPLRCHWVFHLRCTYRVAGTYKETSLRRRHDVSLPGGICFVSQVSSVLGESTSRQHDNVPHHVGVSL